MNPALATTEARVSRIAEILDGLKAENILALDLRGISDFTDFFVIATVKSATQMKAALVIIDEQLRAEGVYPVNPPHFDSPNWCVLDYGSVVVHVFDPETRDHYALEELWGDAGEYDWQSQATA
jgi:ribosome-associated protein